MLWEGGFAPVPRLLFGALAVTALAASAITDRRSTRRVARNPIVLALWALAALGAVSAAWTLGDRSDALRWGLVTGGYGAVAVVAAVTARARLGVERLAGGLCALAAIGGIVGLVAACITGEPFADRIAGAWRPGGTLEYSSALALLEITALPALLRAMCSKRARLAAAGAAGAVIAGAVIGLAGSRMELLLAGLVAATAIAIPERTLRADRGEAAAAVLVVAAAGLAAELLAGGRAHAGAWGLVGLVAACAALCGVWALRRRIRGRPAYGMFGVAAAAALLIAQPHTIAGHRGSDVLHGRGHLWHAAVQMFGDHPVLGSGADSFLVASARYQASGPVRFAHDFPLELAAELGIAGLAIGLVLYVSSSATLWRARRHRAAWLLGPGMGAFLAAGLVDWPWHLAGSGAVWAVCTGGVIGAVTFGRWRPPTPESVTTAARTRSRSRSHSRSALAGNRSR